MHMKDRGLEGADWIHVAEENAPVVGWCEQGNDP